MRISHSRVELYNLCGQKYYYKYVEKLYVDKTYTPLLFGSAADVAFNYLLTQFKDKLPIDAEEGKRLFREAMDKWTGQNELVFFKSEMPEDQYVEGDAAGNQQRVFAHLKMVGQMMVDTYIAEILPLIEEVVDVQVTKSIKNEAGDELILVMDLIAKLKTGETLVLDNKTTGDIKRSYPKNAVQKSQQLSIYCEYTDSRQAGYIILSKRLKDGKIVWHHMIDTIPEEQVNKAFATVDVALRAIKNEEYPKNEKSCWAFGAKCIYWDLCKKGNYKGLLQDEQK